MNKNIKKVFVIMSLTVVLVASTTVFLVHKMRPAFNSSKADAELKAKGINACTAFINFGDYQIHSKHIGNLSSPKILFIHGSPGYWFDFKNILSDSVLINNFCLISFDRPGYGKTSVPAMKNLSNQARLTNKILDHYAKPGERFIIIGHSFGGAVLEQLLINYPEKVKHAIYIAPCLSPEFQEPKWYNIISTGGIQQRVIPNFLKSSNKEMLSLSECLIKNEKYLSKIMVPTTYIQGKKDILVPYQTLNYYKRHHKDINTILLDDLNHFVPWSKPELIIDVINKIGKYQQ
ncbi:alpha/beta fold hydrolase [Marinifilum sp.]|uniref:alpha/beta fold hydrolase n=1 Tax=Marinifilum sp. TaxID=2033137 RepID=UPI003BA9E978